MILNLKKYGRILTSRPAGREAALVFLAYEAEGKTAATVSLEFEGVQVMTPSWLGEFIQTLKERRPVKIEFLPSTNPTVISSIEFVEPEIQD